MVKLSFYVGSCVTYSCHESQMKPFKVGTIVGWDLWTHPNCHKNTLFSAVQAKLYSYFAKTDEGAILVIAPLSVVASFLAFLESCAYLTSFDWWLWLNPGELQKKLSMNCIHSFLCRPHVFAGKVPLPGFQLRTFCLLSA